MPQLPFEKSALFKGRHFNHLLIIQAVRWYVTYKLSYREVCDLMAERGVMVAHTTAAAMGSMLRSRLRENVEEIRAPSRLIPRESMKPISKSGIELANKIKKGQFDTSEITSPGP